MKKRLVGLRALKAPFVFLADHPAWLAVVSLLAGAGMFGGSLLLVEHLRRAVAN